MLCWDTSALIKLVPDEVESVALEAWLDASDDEWVTSVLTEIELTFWAAKQSLTYPVDEMLAQCVRIPINQDVIVNARSLVPDLRSLDAIHVGTALHLGVVKQVLTYDKRLAKVAGEAGFVMLSPGQ